MPLWIPQALLALAILVTLGAGIWMMINARAVARLFRPIGIEPGPGPRLASRSTALAMFVAFNIGWIASVAIWAWAMTDEASEVVEASE